jgi:hypothetical protein
LFFSFSSFYLLFCLLPVVVASSPEGSLVLVGYILAVGGIVLLTKVMGVGGLVVDVPETHTHTNHLDSKCVCAFSIVHFKGEDATACVEAIPLLRKALRECINTWNHYIIANE